LKGKGDEPDEGEDSPLHLAARSGYWQITSSLLQARAQVDPVNAQLYTPLTAALLCASEIKKKIRGYKSNYLKNLVLWKNLTTNDAIKLFSARSTAQYSEQGQPLEYILHSDPELPDELFDPNIYLTYPFTPQSSQLNQSRANKDKFQNDSKKTDHIPFHSFRSIRLEVSLADDSVWNYNSFVSSHEYQDNFVPGNSGFDDKILRALEKRSKYDMSLLDIINVLLSNGWTPKLNTKLSNSRKTWLDKMYVVPLSSLAAP
jgi:hypothetical protein